MVTPMPVASAGRQLSDDGRAGGGESPYRGGLGYAPGLDGIRALAVTGVLLYHARVGWLPGGFLGVDLFLVLSGYLITSLLLVEYRRAGRVNLGRFWAGRARRLLPAATAVILVCLVTVWVGEPGELSAFRGDALASILYVNNWHQILGTHSYFAAFGRPSLLQHYWTLSVEEQFYLVWPLILAAALAGRRRGWAVAVAIAVAVGSALLMAGLYHPSTDPTRVYFGTDTRATPLMVGALLAFLWPLGRMRTLPRRSARAVIDGIGLAGLGAVVWVMIAWHDYDPFVYRGGLAIVAVAAAALIAATAHPAARLAGILGFAPLRWVGQRSYGIYLWHWPIMAMSRPGIDLRWSTWVLVPAQVALTLVLAALSYRFLEMPIRRGHAQHRVRIWLDHRRPRQRLAAVTGSLAITAAFVGVVAAVPSAASPPRHRLTASAAARAPLPGSPSRTARSTRSAPSSGQAAASGREGSTGQAAASGQAASTGHAASPGRAASIGHSATGGSPAPARSAPPPAALRRLKVLSVGASVMLAAESALEQRIGARVDAAVGRQPSAIIARLAAYRRAGLLPRWVVVQIGDNGPLWYADVVALHNVLRGVPHVVLVTVRQSTSWEQEVNDELRQALQTWPQARLADWYAASADPSLLYDGAHPNAAGAAVYADVVAQALGRR